MNWKKLLILIGIIGLYGQQLSACPKMPAKAHPMMVEMQGHHQMAPSNHCQDGEECLRHERSGQPLALLQQVQFSLGVPQSPSPLVEISLFQPRPPKTSPRLEANPHPPDHLLYSHFISLLH